MGDKVEDYIKSLEANAVDNGADTTQEAELPASEELETQDADTAETNEDSIGVQPDDNEVEDADEDEDELLQSIAKAKETEENLDSLPKNVQKKINRETAARKQAEEDNRRLSERLALLESGATANSHSPVGTSEDAIDENLPVSEQVALHLERQQRQAKAQEQQRLQQEHFTQLERMATEKAEKARAIFDDYDEVVTPVAQKLPPALLMAIPKCENMGKVMYYMGKNPAYANSLLTIKDPLELAMKLGKLDQKLSQKPATKKVSSAPKPTTKVGGTAGHGSKVADVSKMGSKQFREFYNTL